MKFAIFMISSLSISCVSSIGSTALAQPFGITMGTNPATLNAKPSGITNHFYVTVPKPHSEFESYLVMSTSQTGICRITGIGKDIKNDAYGTVSKSRFNALSSELSSKYGRNLIEDFLRVGSIWNEPKEFAMSIYKKERSLTAFWDDEEKSNLTNSIESIVLKLNGSASGDLYLNLSYKFRNYEQCTALDKAGDKGAL